jgi:hypothetical protein
MPRLTDYQHKPTADVPYTAPGAARTIVYCRICRAAVNAQHMHAHFQMNHVLGKATEPEPWLRKQEWEKE